MDYPKDDNIKGTELPPFQREQSTSSQTDDDFKDEKSVKYEKLTDSTEIMCNKCRQGTREERWCECCLNIRPEIIASQEMPRTNRRQDQQTTGDKFIYRMNRGGHALLFNHKQYKISDEMQRNGTEYNAQELIDVFKQRKINLHHCQDYNYKKIMEEIKRVANEDHTEKDCLVVIVLTHGILDRNGEEFIFASDKAYPPSQLWLPFSDNRCPTLAGKPKIFIIQACRGVKGNEGVGKSTSTYREAKSHHSGEESYTSFSKAPEDPNSHLAVTNMTDLVVARSTFIGYKSYRFEDTGAIYINNLVLLMKDKNRTDLISLLTKLNCCVSRIKIKEDNKTVLQIPCFTSTLTKKLYI